MDTEIKSAVNAADAEAQYDEKVKRLLGNKIILAHILAKTVDEFLGMDPKDIVPYIERDPLISAVLVEPGLTNASDRSSAGVKALAGSRKDGQRIVGLNTENAEINEGLIRFDIIFYLRMKDGISKVIINLEAQKDEPTRYHLLNRAVFYACRLISSQKERDFVGTNYNDIRRVYSIWICMNMDENSMSYVHLMKDDLLGHYPWKGDLDLLNMVMIGIANELSEHDEAYELHRLLSALLSEDLSVNEKLRIMETEYDIPVSDKIRKDVNEMCNLGQGIRESGEAIGEAKMILSMHEKGYTLEQIADVAEKTREQIEAIIEMGEPVLA
ncbi:MAG: Rpn family recombination-promoting nuclease/putative transposase [Lachnospiraceae bacterium]|nr:Rpn family recombination-promoting nuclease/putative transposase [Lachnospiraceae bacterium]MDE7238400.1 Rpn family recombination-promoting nuclease/putative transposase [Lachnospiraceae bacterium]